MDAITEDKGLPTAIDAQPVVRAAAAMRLKLARLQTPGGKQSSGCRRAGEEFREAGFYSLVMPRSLGGLQADPLTYQRVVDCWRKVWGAPLERGQ